LARGYGCPIRFLLFLSYGPILIDSSLADPSLGDPSLVRSAHLERESIRKECLAWKINLDFS